MLTLIVALFILGLAFIAFELIVPGGIFGLLGLLAILVSWILTFVEYGIHVGLLAVLGGIVLVVISLVIELRFIPRTRIGKRLFLESAIDKTSQSPIATPDLAGKEAEAYTTLAPTGVVMVEGKKYEGFSMSGMVERGARLQVVDYDNFRVRVKKV